MHGAVRTVSATFDESVGVGADSLRVFAPDGRRVDVGGTHAGAGPDTIEVSLAARQPDGTYTVAWHVVSADSHPAEGAFTFSIGHPSRHVPGASVLTQGSATVSRVYAVDRFLGYAGFMGFAGGLVFLALCWPAGTTYRETRGWLAAAWLIAFLSTVLQLPLQAAFAAGRSLSGMVDPHLVGGTVGTHVGTALLVRAVGLVFLAVLALLLLVPDRDRRSSGRSLGMLYVLATGLLAVTWSASGHAVSGSWSGLAVVADLAHLVAGAVWLGGLAMLAGLVLFGDGAPPLDERVSAAGRFSRLAGWSVLLIAVTGTFQAWRNTRAWPALFDTRYGLLVCGKASLLILVVVLGYRARRALGAAPFQRRDPASSVDVVRLRRGVAVEVVVAVVLLGVTAVLVQTPTAAESYHPPASATRPFDTGTRSGTVDVAVSPARLGPNRVRITVRGAHGTPFTPAQLTATLTQDAENIGPITLDLRRTGRGGYLSRPVSLDFVGSWTLNVVVRTDAFDETSVTVPVPVT